MTAGEWFSHVWRAITILLLSMITFELSTIANRLDDLRREAPNTAGIEEHLEKLNQLIEQKLR